MTKPQLVIFDLAGTTVHDNNDVHRVLQSVFDEIDIRISIEEANEVMGIPKPVAIKNLLELHSHPAISESVIVGLHARFVELMKMFYEHHPLVKEKEGASEIFSQLKQSGIKVVVDTGFDRIITDELLKRMGWVEKGLIDASVTSDEVKQGRPHPDLIFKAMELVGITDVSTIAKVGDTISDLQEGTSAGCGWVIGITTGAYSRQQLSAGPHTHLIDHLSELSSIFDMHSVGVSN